jgi:hypothetical protein
MAASIPPAMISDATFLHPKPNSYRLDTRSLREDRYHVFLFREEAAACNVLSAFEHVVFPPRAQLLTSASLLEKYQAKILPVTDSDVLIHASFPREGEACGALDKALENIAKWCGCKATSMPRLYAVGTPQTLTKIQIPQADNILLIQRIDGQPTLQSPISAQTLNKIKLFGQFIHGQLPA